MPRCRSPTSTPPMLISPHWLNANRYRPKRRRSWHRRTMLTTRSYRQDQRTSMRIVATVRALYCWTLREDWRTWVSHFLGAAVLMALGLPGFAVFFAYAFA